MNRSATTLGAPQMISMLFRPGRHQRFRIQKITLLPRAAREMSQKELYFSLVLILASAQNSAITITQGMELIDDQGW
jgi:hypothetical protein